MRVWVSTAMATVLALALSAPRAADALPTISFGSGAKIPPGCVKQGTQDLDCVEAVSTPLTFNVWIHIGSLGMNAYSFGANWDDGTNDELTAVSAAITTKAYITTDPGPPPVQTVYSLVGTPTVTQSTGAAAGSALNWTAISDVTHGTAPFLAVAGHSFRTGSISVTVDGTDSTEISLGWFDPNQDVFGSADGQTLTPIFKKANINAPEPAALLSVLAGVATVAFLSVRSRRSRSTRP